MKKMSRLNDVTSKIQDLETAKATVKRWKETGETVVFTNGCFDILHRGHVTYLAQSADLGTKLVVALNTDASVKRQGKGEERPVNPEIARSLVMASLGFVDLVVLFDGDTPLHEVVALQPSVLVKGADYDANETDPSKKTYIVGSKEVRENGGEIKTIGLVEGFSTTSIIQKLKS
jgi:D-glycero-beta-D-manno-heptose 1-phosphate adenylyltransferase